MGPMQENDKWEKVSSFVEALKLFSQELTELGRSLRDSLYSWGNATHGIKENQEETLKEIRDLKAVLYNLKDNIDGLREEVRKKK